MPPRHWCFHCYGINAAARGTCVHCGQAIEAPESLSFDERLIWALGHPDGDRAMLAAQTLGRRHAHAATPALRAVAERGADPFLAARAPRGWRKPRRPTATRAVTWPRTSHPRPRSLPTLLLRRAP